MDIDGFNWDDGNWPKCAKHGLTKNDIEAVFAGSVDVFPAKDAPPDEVRYLAVGLNGEGRHLFVVFTIRNEGGLALIRPISARFMHEKEVRHYEQQKGSQAVP